MKITVNRLNREKKTCDHLVHQAAQLAKRGEHSRGEFEQRSGDDRAGQQRQRGVGGEGLQPGVHRGIFLNEAQPDLSIVLCQISMPEACGSTAVLVSVTDDLVQVVFHLIVIVL